MSQSSESPIDSPVSTEADAKHLDAQHSPDLQSTKAPIESKGYSGDHPYLDRQSSKRVSKESSSNLPSVFSFMNVIRLSDVRLFLLRMAILLCLMATAVIVGYFSYSLLKANEDKLMLHQYNSLAGQLETYVNEIMNRQYQALSLLSTAYRNSCPTKASWPNCAIPFNYMLATTDNLLSMANARGIGFSPFVTENEVASFETFVYNFYDAQGYSNLGISAGFKGIYARNKGVPFHMTTPSTAGKNPILVPIVQIGALQDNFRAYMFNLYSEPIRIANIDHMINCSIAENTDCLALTDIVQLVQDPIFRPAVLLHYPIRLADANNSIVGLTSGVINWDTMLSFSIPSHVSGIFVVLKAERDNKETFYTFEFIDGEAIFLGVGDLHDKYYDHSMRTFSASPFSGSALYSVSMYSSAKFHGSYHTNGPIIACVISVLVIVITSFIFIMYDVLMNRRAHENELVIQTRQQFVRFISHEIRTPVNTISLGMKLFAKEIISLLEALQVQEHIAQLSHKLVNMLELVRDVEQSSEAAIVILNDLINYDKLKGGLLQLEIEEIAIFDFIRKSIRPFKVQAQQVNVQIVIDLLASADEWKEAGSLIALGDRVKVGQVIRNLVSNALKFTPPGGTVTVTATWNRQGLPKATKLEVTEIADEDTVVDAAAPPVSQESMGTVNDETTRKQNDSNNPYAVIGRSKQQYIRSGSLIVMVRDSGVGLSEEQQGNLFREGVQFNANKLQGGGGSGLGLFIAKGIAELHGGTLHCSSEGIGKGCNFTLEIPLYEKEGMRDMADIVQQSDEDRDIECGIEGQQSIPTLASRSRHLEDQDDNHSLLSRLSTHGGSFYQNNDLMISPLKDDVNLKRKQGQRILVVDDAPTARKMVTRLLMTEGYMVDQCSDGQSCLDTVLSKFQRNESQPYYCVILLDSDMPGISGLEVAKELRKAEYPWPIIGLTGHVLKTDIDNFVAHGASIVLNKPLDYSRLEKALSDFQ